MADIWSFVEEDTAEELQHVHKIISKQTKHKFKKKGNELWVDQ